MSREERLMSEATGTPTTCDPELVADLVVANWILFDENVLDGFGHVSVRHDKDPSKYVMSRHLAPGLVTAGDVLDFTLDSDPVRDIGKRYYSERFIHGEIYKARPDVLSVVHCHAPPLIPFGVTSAKLKPIYHMTGFLGLYETPVFEIRDAGGVTDMLIRTPALGRALATTLGERPMVLMRGHGATMVGSSVRQAVYRAIYATQNAALQVEAIKLGEVNFLTPGESQKAADMIDGVLHRPWELWKRRALDARRTD
jgi:HCOMODA/2-hydroxy-3-carboxy-muconic semialdehyde decarboxylase